MGRGNGVQALQHTFGAVQRHALDPAAAQLSGLVEGGVTLVDIGGHPLRFDPAHLGFADTLFGNFGNLGYAMIQKITKKLGLLLKILLLEIF